MTTRFIILLLLLAASVTIYGSSTSVVTDTVLAKTYLEKGDELYFAGNVDSSNYYYDKAAAEYLKVAQDTDLKRTWIGYLESSYFLVWNLIKAGELQRAEKILGTNIEIALSKLGRDHEQTANIYGAYSEYYQSSGNYDAALESGLATIEILTNLYGKEDIRVANPIGNIGTLYQNMGFSDKALHYQELALRLRQQIKDEKERNQSVGVSYNNIGYIYNAQASYDQALDYYHKSLDLKKKGYPENHPSLILAHLNIGASNHKKGNYGEALKFYQKTMEITLANVDGDHPYVATIHNNIGSVFSDMGDLEQAKKSTFQSLLIREKIYGPDHLVVAVVNNNLSDIYYQLDNLDSAIFYQKKTLDIRNDKLPPRHEDLAESSYALALFYSKMDSADLALSYLEDALNQNYTQEGPFDMNPNRVDLLHYFSYEILLKSLFKKSEILLDTSPKDSLEHALKPLILADRLVQEVKRNKQLEEDKLGLLESYLNIYSLALEIIYQMIEKEAPFTGMDLMERAFYFEEQGKATLLQHAIQEANARSFGTIPDSLLEKENDLQVRLSFYQQQLLQNEDEGKEPILRSKIFDLRNEYHELISYLNANYKDYYELKYSAATTSIASIQSLLQKKAALVSYFTTSNYLYVLIIKRDQRILKQIRIDDAFHRDIRGFKNSIYYRNKSTYIKAARRLYATLFPDDILKGVDELILVPDASLMLIPFEALLTEDVSPSSDYTQLPYFLKKTQMSYAFSGTLWYNSMRQSRSKNQRVLSLAPVFANESGNNFQNLRSSFKSLSPLPGTLEEVGQISAILNTKGTEESRIDVVTHDKATEQFFKTNQLDQYNYIHIASHGFVNYEKGDLSGILFYPDQEGEEDGILYSGEIYNLQLNADLVTLSACETGLGELRRGEGIMGLGRAFTYAGARNLLVSLWQVNDASTSQLMVDFYQQLISRQRDMNDALRLAKLQLVKDAIYSNPYYWSPFIKIGQ